MHIAIKIIIDFLKILPPLILISFVSLFFIRLLNIKDFLEKIILIFTFNWVQIIIPIELLSIFKILTLLNIYIFYGAVALICLIFFIIKKIPIKVRLFEIKQSFKNFYGGLNLNKVLKLVLIIWLIIILFVPLFIGSAMRPPNYDSMTYHLARAAFWYQNHSINHYFTRYVHQNDYPVNAEIGFLWVILFTNSDIFTFLVQWLSFVIILLCLYKLLRVVGYSRNISLVTTFIFSTFDICILEASSTQNDMIVACFIILSLYFLVKAFKSTEVELKYLIFLGITTGIVLGTKGYSYLFIPGFILFILLFTKNDRKKFLKITFILLFVIAGFLLFASYSLIQNYISYGNLLGYPGTIAEMRMDAFGYKEILSNFLRHAVSFYQKYKGFGFISNHIENAFNTVHSKLNFDISSPSTTWGGVYFGIWEHRINFDTSYSGLLFFLFVLPSIFLNFILFLALGKKNRDVELSTKYKTSLKISIIPILFFIGYIILFKWHIWAGRYMIAFSLLIMINVAEFFDLLKKIKVRYLFNIFIVILVFLSIWSSVLPLFKNEYISLADIIKNKISKTPQIQATEENAITFMLKANEMLKETLPDKSNIGIILDQSDWVYIYFGEKFQKKLKYITDDEWNNNTIKKIMKDNKSDGILVNSNCRDFNNGKLKPLISKFTGEPLLTVDYNNFNRLFKPLNGCSFIMQKNSILVKVTNNDPYFETTFPFKFGDYDSLIMTIDLESKVESYLKIYYGLKNKIYNENDTNGFKINPGGNEIYLEIPQAKNMVKLRIDPIEVKEDIIINNIEIYSKSSLNYKNIGNYYLFFK